MLRDTRLIGQDVPAIRCQHVGTGFSTPRDCIGRAAPRPTSAVNVVSARVRPLLQPWVSGPQPLIWHGFANGGLHPAYETTGDKAESNAPRSSDFGGRRKRQSFKLALRILIQSFLAYSPCHLNYIA
jgi:hypothetical protein